MPEAALSAEGLGKRFGGLQAVAEVSLEAWPGEIHAVIGPNGAGKTTLVNLLSGDLKPTAGEVRLQGASITRLPPESRARRGLARSYQKTTLFPAFTVFENARLAAQARSRRPLGLFRRAEADAETNGRAETALATVDLLDRAGIVAAQLSHGEQRQLEIAAVLATAPSVVLLDEPLAGMGQAEAARMVALIARLKEGRAVLLVEHDMDAVFRLADRLTVMADGRVIASGRPDEVRAHPAVRQAYLGHDHPILEGAAV